MSTFDYEHLIIDIPDYPKPGIVFKDITPLLADHNGFAACIDNIATHFAHAGITKILGTEARGFMIGAPVAYKLGAGFVPARKPGKLPRECYEQEYALEYGTDKLEIHKDALNADDVVLIVDDLIATGGTAAASVKLAQRAGAKVAGLGFLLELTAFDPRAVITKVTDAEFYSLVQVKTF
jgi:adenine phosphoribosyltransferase